MIATEEATQHEIGQWHGVRQHRFEDARGFQVVVFCGCGRCFAVPDGAWEHKTTIAQAQGYQRHDWTCTTCRRWSDASEAERAEIRAKAAAQHRLNRQLGLEVKRRA